MNRGENLESRLEIIVEQCSHLVENNLQTQGSQWNSSRIHKYIHIWIHCCQPDESGKREILIVYRGTTACLISDFFSEIMEARGQEMTYSKWERRKRPCQPRKLYSTKLFFIHE